MNKDVAISRDEYECHSASLPPLIQSATYSHPLTCLHARPNKT